MTSSKVQRLLTFFRSFLCLKDKPLDETSIQTKLCESSLFVTENPQEIDLRDEKIHIPKVVELQQELPQSQRNTPELYIAGLGTQYPANLIGPEATESFTKRWSDVDSNIVLQKFLHINRNTGIKTRAVIRPTDDPQFNQSEPPNICDIDIIFRTEGVDLVVEACKRAMAEWGGSVDDITHTVTVTGTNTGAPGYEFLVARKLGLPLTTDQTLLSGVGCAGGLSALCTAANLARGAGACGRPARVLVMACELCSIQMRAYLASAEQHPLSTNVAAALFGDGAAAFILCNEFAAEVRSKAVYTNLECISAALPDTVQHLTLLADPLGYKAEIGREVVANVAACIFPTFQSLLPAFLASSPSPHSTAEKLTPQSFDWALHPGGIAILKGAQKALQLSDHQLRASYEVYANRGNTSSVTVISVLDKLRHMGEGKENVVAISFGPGMIVEIAMLRRWRG